jgi:hypothetical protein
LFSREPARADGAYPRPRPRHIRHPAHLLFSGGTHLSPWGMHTNPPDPPDLCSLGPYIRLRREDPTRPLGPSTARRVARSCARRLAPPRENRGPKGWRWAHVGHLAAATPLRVPAPERARGSPSRASSSSPRAAGLRSAEGLRPCLPSRGRATDSGQHHLSLLAYACRLYLGCRTWPPKISKTCLPWKTFPVMVGKGLL